MRSTSIKPYFINNPESVPDSLALTQVPPAKVTPAKTPQTEAPTADVTSIEPTVESPSATLASLASIKQGRGRLRKYLKQANVAAPSDICFLMDEFDVFIKNVDAPLAQYTASRQKKITRLLEKGVFKVVTGGNIPSNA